MEIKYSKKFLKELSSIEVQYRKKAENIVFNDIYEFNPFDLGIIEKLTGYKNKYKIRIGQYRIGITIDDDILYLERIIHRSKIYKVFP